MENEYPHERASHDLLEAVTTARLCSSALAHDDVALSLVREAFNDLGFLLHEIEHNRKVAA